MFIIGKIVAISGGDLHSTDSLNKYALTLTKKEKPNVLFIPTASYDSKEYINKINVYYRNYNCNITNLCLYSNTYSKEELINIFNDIDLIYVGGGNTESMIEKWKEFDIDKMLIKSYKKGTVLTGISAGANYLFTYGHSDSEYFYNPNKWNYKFVKGLNLVENIAFCPHYNENGRKNFDKMLDKNLTGLALDNDTAIIIIDGIKFLKKANSNANAYILKYRNNKITKTKLLESIPFNI